MRTITKNIFILTILCSAWCVWAKDTTSLNANQWNALFDGRRLQGWKASEHSASFKVIDGAIVCNGPRAHLFYTGQSQAANFTNFEFKADVMTRPGANSGIFFHTAFQESGWPEKGFEVQINNTHLGSGSYRELKKTGSLYGVRNLFMTTVKDNQWFNIHFIVRGKRVIIKVNETFVVDYIEPASPVRAPGNAGNIIASGTFALQCHDPSSKVFFKNIMVKPLPDDASDAIAEPPKVDERYAQIIGLHEGNFPIVDFHVHLKGGLTLDEALENSRKTGINYGIAVNCGIGFPVTNDHGIHQFLKTVEGQPVFIGLQAEGREWTRLFSKEAISRFDYVFTDALTFTDDNGKRMRLWINDEVDIKDKQQFMELYVGKIVEILNNEPIDIFVNPTFLPECIANEYDQLWTQARMQKVIDAAVKNNIAIEINARYRIPSRQFIQLAKKAGAKFSFGTNNGGRELGNLEYCLEIQKQLGLTSADMFMPKTKNH